ncbi:MAG: hypothetical protein ACK4ZJ_19640, partial [Allorhizobium sp.]
MLLLLLQLSLLPLLQHTDGRLRMHPLPSCSLHRRRHLRAPCLGFLQRSLQRRRSLLQLLCQPLLRLSVRARGVQPLLQLLHLCARRCLAALPPLHPLQRRMLALQELAGMTLGGGASE